MLYMIGLGLNEEGISLEGFNALKKCKKIYLENYTVEFPYKKEKLEKMFRKKIIPSNRENVESLKIVDEARKENIALLIYGNPLMATTHVSLIQEAKIKKVKLKVVHSASILDGVSETGLQIYKFGKITSIPNFESSSFMDTIRENLSIKAHSIILVDIGLKFEEAIGRIKKASAEKGVEIKMLVVCEKLGTKNSRIYYGKEDELMGKKIKTPFCFIIPGKLHFLEEEVLNSFKNEKF